MTRAIRPASLDEAVRALAEPGAIAVAGCTDLLVVDTAQRRRHDTVVDLLRLPELRGIRVDGDALEIGAATSFTELRHSEEVLRHAPALAAAAATVGGWQIQNRGTLGGNIVNASPAGDSLPVLLALDAVPSDLKVGTDLCQHCAFTKPIAITSDQLPPEQVAKVRETARQIAEDEGKPPQIIEKIVEGKLRAFCKEHVLIDQEHVKPDYEKKSIGTVLQEAGVGAVSDLAVFQVGAD